MTIRTRKLGSWFVVLAALSHLGGCAGEVPGVPDAEDGENEPALGEDKPDTAGITDASPEAAGVLIVANTLTLDELDHAVRLSSRVARNIVAVREGDDEQPGTDDDQRFDDLAELDAVPYVGPSVFSTMLDYARAAGLVRAPTPSVFDTNLAEYVGEDRLTVEELAELLFDEEESDTVKRIGISARYGRTRTCDSSGCTAWVGEDADAVNAPIYLDREGASLQIRHTDATEEQDWRGGSCITAEDPAEGLECMPYPSSNRPLSYYYELGGGLSANKLLLRTRASEEEPSGDRVEKETLILGSFSLRR